MTAELAHRHPNMYRGLERGLHRAHTFHVLNCRKSPRQGALCHGGNCLHGRWSGSHAPTTLLTCPWCDADREDLKHVIWECPKSFMGRTSTSSSTNAPTTRRFVGHKIRWFRSMVGLLNQRKPSPCTSEAAPRCYLGAVWRLDCGCRAG